MWEKKNYGLLSFFIILSLDVVPFEIVLFSVLASFS